MNINQCKELQQTTHRVVHESPEQDIYAMKCLFTVGNIFTGSYRRFIIKI